MKKIIIFILFIGIFFSCQKKISQTEQAQVEQLLDKASISIANFEEEQAKQYLLKAKKINPEELAIYLELFPIYIEQDSLAKAMEILENSGLEKSAPLSYHNFKGGLYEHLGELENAIPHYEKSFAMMKKPRVKDEMDLYEVINYGMTATLIGKKEEAVQFLNEIMNKKWMTENNIEYLSFFRNEFEHYKGGGNLEFNPSQDLMIKTVSTDRVETKLKQYHINSSGESFGKNDTVFYYFSEKYRAVLQQLNFDLIKNHEN